MRELWMQRSGGGDRVWANKISRAIRRRSSEIPRAKAPNEASEADAVAGIPSSRLAWSGDFDNVASSKAIVSGDWVGELYSWQLRFLESAVDL